MMMLNDTSRGPTTTAHSSMPTGLSVTPTAASANANANRRPRAQSMQQFSDKSSSALGSPSARDCSSSGSFVSKLYRMVDSEPSSIVSWTRGGTAFCIVDPKMMAEHCLPKYFRHRRFSSLIRQLNFYSFYRVQEGQLAIYQHSFFRKGRPDLLVHIKRRGAGKAKDPWFDPLATTPSSSSSVASTPPLPSSSHTTVANKNTSAMMATASTNPSLNLNVINVSTMAPSNGMMCYSPMSKPVMMENMSPALKPGMAPNAPPPMMDMGAPMLGAASMSDDLMLASKQQQPSSFQRWDAHKEHELQSFGLASPMPLKHKFLYMDANVSATHSPMLRASEYSSLGMPTPLDLDIQDFLTEDCSINTSCVSEMKAPFDDRVCHNSSSMQHAKHAMVSRDLLKWDAKCDADVPSSHVAGLTTSSSNNNHSDVDTSSSNGTFEDELLLDLANVEPDAWEVPLSPLNEDEDMMPWLDLCF